MSALTSPNFIMMQVNSIDNDTNTTIHTNMNFNVNVVNIGFLDDSNTILHSGNVQNVQNNEALLSLSLSPQPTQPVPVTTTKRIVKRKLPSSIVIVSSDDDMDDIANSINIKTDLKNKRVTDKKFKLKRISNSKKINNGLHDSVSGVINIDDVRDDNVIVPVKKKLSIYTYEQLLTEKYKMDELRKLCMQYKVSRAGNKDDIIKRLYDFCKNSIIPLKIQKVVRGFLHRKLIKLRGPAFQKRNICTNETDFFTMDEMHEIPYEQFYSFKDLDGFIYGFNILSLHNLIVKEGETTKNPYNRTIITSEIKNDIKRIVKLSNIFKIHLDIVIKQEVMDPRKRMEMKILDLFQTINSYGNYANSEWFTDLSRTEHVRFARELYDIWNYRAQLSNLKKYEICPPHGSPFLGTPYFTNTATNINLIGLGIDTLMKYNIQIIENLIKSALDVDNKTLGSFYVLTSLTLVSQPARNAMPWLYEAGVYGGGAGDGM